MTTREPDDDHEVLAPVPDPTDDLGHLTVFEDDAAPDAAPDAAIDAVAGAAYDDETDLAVPVHGPDASVAFTPYGGSVPAAGNDAAYDRERDTGL